MAGYGADPSAPGAAFPIVLTRAVATFVNGPPPTPPIWTASADLGDDVVITLTGYRKGKIIGMLTGTLRPGVLMTTGDPIQVSATFAAKCTVQ